MELISWEAPRLFVTICKRCFATIYVIFHKNDLKWHLNDQIWSPRKSPTGSRNVVQLVPLQTNLPFQSKGEYPLTSGLETAWKILSNS